MQERLEAVFGRAGPLAAKISEYRVRSQQVEMAMRVAEAIRDNAALVCEAGTGTGKTFAYLVPALLSAGKVIISTGTKTLQDQLYHRDLPTVRDIWSATWLRAGRPAADPQPTCSGSRASRASRAPGTKASLPTCRRTLPPGALPPRPGKTAWGSRAPSFATVS